MTEFLKLFAIVFAMSFTGVLIVSAVLAIFKIPPFDKWWRE